MSSLFNNNCFFDSDPHILSQFQLKPFPPLFDAMQTYEQELKIGPSEQKFTTTHNIQMHIKHMNHFEYGYIHKIEQNYSNSKKTSLLYDSNTKTKTKTTTDKKKHKREDNSRRMIGTDVFNHYFKHIIEGYISNNGLVLCFEKFPKEFLIKVTKKKNVSYLDKTIEELIEDKELYNNTKPNSNFENNLKVIKAIKNKNENNLNNFLKKKYPDLIKDYLSSKEFKQKIKQLKRKKGIEEANKYESFCKKYVENLNNKAKGIN